MTIKFIPANNLSAYNHKSVGTKVTDVVGFDTVVEKAIESFDFAGQRVPGQGVIKVPEAVPFVSAGVGRRSADPEDYVNRSHRGEVGMFLKREKAVPAEDCAVVVYTTEAYLVDPDVKRNAAEIERVKASGATHVIVAVLAYAGPKAPLTPYRFVHNLAGGNKEALAWTADEIRQKAEEVMAYDREWAVVAD